MLFRSFSIAWYPDSDSELIVGSDKYIRIVDIRLNHTYKSNLDDVHSKQVLGIKFDPFKPTRVATMTDDIIKIFDLRNPKKPMFVIKDADS